MNSMFLKRAVALGLSCAVAVSLVPMFTGNSEVKADEWVKSKENTIYGLQLVKNPKRPSSSSTPWQGNYVYFGKNNGNPIKFRVLDCDSTAYGGNTLFLDSDMLFDKQKYDEDSSVWADSDLRKYFNGEFIENNFSAVESKAIFPSTVESHDYSNDIVPVQDGILSNYKSYTALDGDKIFPLDYEEVSNPQYGYHKDDGANHIKTIINSEPYDENVWWLRSDHKDKKNYKKITAISNVRGTLIHNPCDNDYFASPALNIDRSKILFSTLISGKAAEDGAEYKLTLKDDEIKLALSKTKEVSFEGNRVTVPYTLSGKNAGNVDQLSLAIESNSWFNLNYYKKLDVTPSANGTVSFELPDDFKPMRWGISYRIYLIAEDVNGMKETDYAGEPLLIENPGITLDVRTPFQADQEVRAYLGNICYGQLINGFYTTEKDMKYDIDKDGEYDLIVYAEENGGYLAKLDNCKLRGSYDLNDLDEHYYKIKKYTFILSDLDVSLDKVSNGTASVSKTSALRDDEITVKAKPDPGYVLDKITYTPKGGTAVDITSSKKFTMPNEDVSVKVTFKNQASLTLDKTKADVICGNSLSLKATLKGADSKVSWKSSNTKIATVDANGKITAKQAGAVTITASAAGKTAKCTVQVLFKDVINTKEFWYEPTYYLANMNVVKGYDNQTLFKPAVECTRAQMLTFMWRLAGCPEPKSSKCDFPDVKSGDYFFKPVIWAVENGITTGYSDKTFKPKNVCSRAQTVTFLWRMAGKPNPKTKENKFKDVKSNAYYYKATLWASEMKILAGYDDGTFRPDGLCLRRQMVTFLYKYDKYVNKK